MSTSQATQTVLLFPKDSRVNILNVLGVSFKANRSVLTIVLKGKWKIMWIIIRIILPKQKELV